MRAFALSLAAFAFPAVTLFAADSLKVALEDRDGRSLDGADGLTFDVSRAVDANGVETWKCRLVSEAADERFVRIVASGGFESSGEIRVFDGLDTKSLKGGSSENSVLYDRHFPLVGAWDGSRGTAMALGAEDFNSFASFRRAEEPGKGVRMELVVNAALLAKGSAYSCTFHRFAFDPKYGIREAFARYYPLYPKRFYRNPEIDQRVYGISSGYQAWKHTSPEENRLCHADWDWCYAAGRSWGDALNQFVPTEPRNTAYSYDEKITCTRRDGARRVFRNAEQSLAAWDALIAERLAACRYCGVAATFYMMMLSNISQEIAKNHADSLETVNPVEKSGYPYAPSAYTFPECSWGREARRQLAALAEKQRFEATAFDVACPGSVYRGERLKEMSNVGFDRYGAGVVRGVASAKLFEFVRTLRVKGSRHRMAVAENNHGGHIADCLYADLRMVEGAPWDHAPPFPLEGRLASGEKGLTLWEYDYESFDPDYKRWPKEDLDQFKRDLIRFSMQRAFYAGVALPADRTLFDTEYGIRMSEAMSLCLHAGWKPVPGAKILPDGKGEVARFGSGESAFLAVNNPARERMKMSLEVFPSEIDTGFVGDAATDAIAFAPYYGGLAGHTVGEAGEKVTFIAGPQLVMVLEGVGRVRGSGRFAIGWQGTPGRIELVVESKDFAGRFEPRRKIGDYLREGDGPVEIAAGGTVRIAYRDAFAADALAKTEGAAELAISDDVEGSDAADAVNDYLRCAGFRKLPVRKQADLSPRSLRIGSLTLTGVDEEELQRRVRRMLDVWNAVRHPEYMPAVRLDPSERAFFGFRR